MSKQFKVGPTKTRGGDEVHIMDIHGGYIYGRYLSGKREAARWRLDGREMSDSLAPYDIRRMFDLMSNSEAEKFTFECWWAFEGTIHPQIESLSELETIRKLRGKRTRVEVTVLDDGDHDCDHLDCEGIES